MISRTEIEERKENAQTEGSSGPNELENSVNQILKRTQKFKKIKKKQTNEEKVVEMK